MVKHLVLLQETSIAWSLPNELLHEYRLKGKVPTLHPIADMRLQDPSLEKLLARETQLQLRLEGLPFHDDKDREEQLQR